VIVIAGAKLAGKIFGNEVDVSRQDATPVQVVNAPSEPVPVTPSEEGTKP
jgi:hypothetical protein